MRIATLTLGAMVMFAVPAAADRYVRSDGKAFDAAVVEAGADRVRFLLTNGREQVLQRDQLSPDSHFRALLKTRAPKDAVERLGFARLCLEARLYGPARAQVQAAISLDGAIAVDAAELTGLIDEGQARDLLTRGLELLAGGKRSGAPLLLEVINRFPATAALPAAAGALKQWSLGVAPKPAQDPPKPGAGAAPPQSAVLAAIVDPALKRAKAHQDAGAAIPRSRGDRRVRSFQAAETELEAARRAVLAVQRAGRAPAAECDARLTELQTAFIALAVVAGGKLIESRRTKEAHAIIYRALALAPAHAGLLALQATLAGATLEGTEDPSKMPFGELARRVARGAATAEMRRIYRRRAAARGLEPGAAAPAPGPVVPTDPSQVPPDPNTGNPKGP